MDRCQIQPSGATMFRVGFWEFFWAALLASLILGFVREAQNPANYAERGREYVPERLAGCVFTWSGRYCGGAEDGYRNRDRDEVAEYGLDGREEW